MHQARSACFPPGRTVAFDFGLCGFYLTLLFSSFHVHSQASFQTYTPHRCGSWSSRLHPGAGTCACAKQACIYVCANSIRVEEFLDISVFCFPLVVGRERNSRKVISFFFFVLFFFFNSNWAFSGTRLKCQPLKAQKELDAIINSKCLFFCFKFYIKEK